MNGVTSNVGLILISACLLADIAGPIARTVEDATKVFQVIVGADPTGPITAAAPHLPQNYLASLDRNGLKGRHYRRPPPSLRTRIHRPRNRPHLPGRRRRFAPRRSHHRGPRQRERSRPDQALPRRRPVHGLQVRHQSLPRGPERRRPGKIPNRNHPVPRRPPARPKLPTGTKSAKPSTKRWTS